MRDQTWKTKKNSNMELRNSGRSKNGSELKELGLKVASFKGTMKQ
jgi:hypothetical protein